MGKREKLNDFECGQIRAFFDENYSSNQISKKINRLRKVISSYLANMNDYGKTPRSGRPFIISPRKRRAIIREARGKSTTANQIKSKFNIEASKDTILRILKMEGNLSRRNMKRKPVLKNFHKV